MKMGQERSMGGLKGHFYFKSVENSKCVLESPEPPCNNVRSSDGRAHSGGTRSGGGFLVGWDENPMNAKKAESQEGRAGPGFYCLSKGTRLFLWCLFS